MSFETAIQDVILSTLRADAALLALVSGVYDSVPQKGTEYPYVTIGEDNHNEWDTDTTLGSDCTITIHTWSRHRGRGETKQIQGTIYDALHRAELTVDGYRIHTIDLQNSQSFTDADGLTRHGVQTFRVLIERV